MRLFCEIASPSADTSILDIGGYAWFWADLPVKSDITIINIEKPNISSSEREAYQFVMADGRNLPFPDNAFDIVFSNSVIEHLFTYENQKRFAEETRKAGKRLWVQTPARWFPIETHLKSPLIHYLPASMQRKLIKNFSVWGLMTRPTQEETDALLSEIRLLTYKEMKDLFPDCRIIKEKFLFFTKSYIAYR